MRTTPVLAKAAALLLLIGIGHAVPAQPLSPGVASVAAAPSNAAAGMQPIYGATPCPDHGDQQSPLCDTHPGPGYAAPQIVEHGGFKMPASWSAPVAPFRIVGNIYYVGVAGLGAYLFASPRD